MPLFTASAQAIDYDGDVEVVQLVVAAYDARHAIDLCCAALERHNQRTRRQRNLPYFRLIAASVKERPETCVLTPERGRFANIHNGNFYGAHGDAQPAPERGVPSHIRPFREIGLGT